ncbi:DUF992 domain-containing protein [Pseudooceanicola lipolyticus]|uniref:DUF992 domain-containing protein n=1 Tax=Pseudooceanicola lipolyticus TaxID=2029104 RepID=A0A2M8IXU1_9RHOB|nr:DUF992 domain-containing protein [Pseudooceanicola lipolyticus]PJE35365.1 DUF992 domain-containing protein [Pseudooceanicola lipolyticus]
MLTRPILSAIALSAATLTGGAALADTGRVELGNLSCDVGAGSGYVFGSSKSLTCTFNPVQEGLQEETYVGTINRYGIDIGATEEGQMSWVVLAPTEDGYEAGALAGEYGGVGAEATVGVGAGANLMVGGSDDTIALQPLSVSTQDGVNFAAGIAEISLEKAG